MLDTANTTYAILYERENQRKWEIKLLIRKSSKTKKGRINIDFPRCTPAGRCGRTSWKTVSLHIISRHDIELSTLLTCSFVVRTEQQCNISVACCCAKGWRWIQSMCVKRCCSPDQTKAVRVGSDACLLRAVQRIGRWGADEKHYLRVLLVLYPSRVTKMFNFHVWDDTVGRRRQAFAP